MTTYAPSRLASTWLLALSALACGGAACSEDREAPATAVGEDRSSEPPGSSSPPDAAVGDDGGGRSSACTPRTPPTLTGLWVAPDGTANGDGSAAAPYDLETALAAGGPARPGDTVLLRGGLYQGRFESTISGTEALPIVIRAAPGEHVRLDGNAAGSTGSTLAVRGHDTHFHDFEVFHSGTHRITTQSGSAPTDIDRGGVAIYGPRNKIIHFTVHDTGGGIDPWKAATNTEVYGSFVYNQGWLGPDRGHGHSVYTQSNEGTMRFAHNVFFFGYSFGMHAYGSANAPLRGFDLIENVWFRSGASVPGEGGMKDGCLIGGGQPAERVRLIGNIGWGPSVGERSVALGYGDTPCEDVLLERNTIVGRTNFAVPWSSVTLRENEFYGAVSGVDTAEHPDNLYSNSLPTADIVRVFPDRYDATRALVVILQAGDAASVEVALDQQLPKGASYTLHSAFDLFGEPVTAGSYDGGAVTIAMGSKPAPQPIGAPDAITGSDDPGRRFGVFVLRWVPCE